MVDFLILYEHRARELENVCLIKCELEIRGYSVDILNIQDYNRLSYLFKGARVILTPALYDNTDFYYHVNTIVGKINKVVNLHWEQVLSDYWEELKFHNPREKATYASHICWGEASHTRLTTIGVKNAVKTGPIHFDFLRPEFKEYYLSKSELLNIHGIDAQKKIVLYISSFTLASMDESSIANSSKRLGTDMSDFHKSMLESKKETLKWIEQLLESKLCLEFIYRPHPNELSDESLKALERKYSNFRVISDHSVKQWILTSDKIFTWISTSIAESFFAGKYCGILRPIPFNPKLEPVIYKGAEHINTLSQFIKAVDMQEERSVSIDSKLIKEHYDYDNCMPSYIRVCNFLENVYKTDEFNIPDNLCAYNIKAKDLMIPLLKKLLSKANGMTNNWIFSIVPSGSRLSNYYKTREKQNEEIASDKEISEISTKLKRILRER